MIKKILFLLLFPTVLFAQGYIYKEFGLNEGLPSLQTYNMYQDKYGVIWFATDRGIATFNGYEFKQYGIKDGLLSNVVMGFYPQADGKIYCPTFDGTIFYFDADFKGFKPYKYNHVLKRTLHHTHAISNIYIDKEKNLHVNCIYRLGKVVINKNGKVVEDFKASFQRDEERFAVYEDYNDTLFYYLVNKPNLRKNKKSIPCDAHRIELIKLPGSGYIIFKTNAEVFILDRNGKKIKTIKSKFNPVVVKAVSSTSFFIGYYFGGGKIVDINGNIIETFLKDQSISNFLIDREGGYWFTTLFSGVFYIKNPKIRIYDQINDDMPIYSLTKNNRNELFASYDNGTISKIDLRKKPSIYYQSGINYRSFIEYDKITGKSLFYSAFRFIKNENEIKIAAEMPYILKFSEATPRGILVSQLGHIRQVDLNGNVPDKFITIPFRGQDACYVNNDIYIASSIGIYQYTQAGKLTNLKKQNRLFNYRVDDIDYNTKRNELYMASLGRGLIIYNLSTGKVTAVTKKEGLLSDIVNEVYIENEKEIWACTNSGINKITFNDRGTFNIAGLKSSDGLLNDGISDVEIINDTVWVASKKGLVYAPKEVFDNQKKQAGYLFRIKRVLVNEKQSSMAYLKNLSHNENRLEFNFEGVSLKSEGNLVYNYKLEGLDTKWYSTKNRKVTFSSLPYGEYIFKIGVQQTNNIVSRGVVQIPIIIHAPFWKTWWFLALSIVLALSIIYFFFKIRVLSYNKDITRELLRILIKKIKKRDNYFIFREAGKVIRVKTDTILYIKSSGNYIELVTEVKTFIVRCKIGDFIQSAPDPLEYLRVHRSYIIRIDKVEGKSKTEVIIRGEKIPVSESYSAEIDNLIF